MFAAYGAVLVWLLLANLALVAVTGGGAVSPGILVASLALNSASLVVASLVGSRRAAELPAVRLRTGPGRLSWRAVLLGIVGLLALSQSLDSLLALLDVRESGALGLLHQMLARTSGIMAGLMLLIAGAAAPAAEEVFFRGFVQTRLATRLSRWPAIGVTAGAFGLMHLDPVHGAFALAVGLYLGWLTELAGSIRPAIGAHVANNVLSLAQAWLLPHVASARAQAGLLAAHLLLAACLIVLLRRGRGAGSGSSATVGSSSRASSSSR